MIKILTGVFDKVDNSKLKLLWKYKCFRIGKTISKIKEKYRM